MTTRLKAFVVTLNADIREDDAESIRTALLMVKHVASVEPLSANLEDHTARMRVRAELAKKLWKLCDEILKGE
jgi:hypothetical protein